jgi:hypothetical protein
VRAAIEGRNMKVVGWYHSHPLFAPQPSIRDVQNQQNYQTLFHDSDSHMFPFVGMIVSPYDGRLSSAASALTMFYVEAAAASTGGGTPKRCIYEVHSLPPPPTPDQRPSAAGARHDALPPPAAADGSAGAVVGAVGDAVGGAVVGAWLPERAIPPMKLAAGDPMRRYWEARLLTAGHTLCALVQYYRKHRSRTQLRQPWKRKIKGGVVPPEGGAAGAGGAPPYTKLDKLIKSVRSRIVLAFGGEAVDALLGGIVEYIDANGEYGTNQPAPNGKH